MRANERIDSRRDRPYNDGSRLIHAGDGVREKGLNIRRHVSEGGGTSKLGLEVVHVRHDAAILEQGAETHPRVSRTDENERRPTDVGAPQGQGTAQADRLNGSVGSPHSTRPGHLLRNSADIRLVFKEGKRVSCPLFTLLYRRNALDRTRVGVVVGKKLGGAVARNRSKRRFRELGRLSLAQMPAGVDLLILPKRESVDEPARSLRESWQAVLTRARLVTSEDSR